jgi:hypothetical protein
MEENNNNNQDNNRQVINILISSIENSQQNASISELVLELLQFNAEENDDNNDDNNQDEEETNNQEEDQDVEMPLQQNDDNPESDINVSNSIRNSLASFRSWLNVNQRSYNTYDNFMDYIMPSRLVADTANSIVENVILQSLNQKPVYKNVLSDEAKDDLRKINYKPNEIHNTSCPILLVDFEEGQEIIVLPCNHCFLPEGIEKWLQEEKAECPVCRFKLKSKEIKDTSQETLQSRNINRLRPNQNNDININRQNLFRSLNNSYSYFPHQPSHIPQHPYGPLRERNVIPHSYIPQSNNISQEEMFDIEMAILLSLQTTDNSIHDELI